ncbi:DUF6415 family natural product biosynthesis protein [Streptomyces griseomycini]|uniref:DNA polymerase/3'-5' exonuclease PolX n=1 Tax=Streptomyces griseomycini TaxID=66895 RepID=A0A7W7VA32_9ACTN|nr:DUF6415 family natural product biosynthesis protein [Streptomyces griseomycini]MBB4902535.1 DNA polymerase/3'-5' exonuclease PolX [Streptomyces griseomycini]GGR52276.1 hypothetical protein GCM10015536_67270 [Streptomyces griseomycini]
MTAPVPALRWTPPLDAQALTGVLEKVRQWTPFDGGALLDDIATALDDVAPSGAGLEGLAQRLHEHLTRLVDIAIATEAAHEDHEAGRLAQRARALHAERTPADHQSAVGHLRRMAWAANELLERLAAIGCLKEAA